MPHHSKQTQQNPTHPMNGGALAYGESPRTTMGHLHTQQSFPPTDGRVDYSSRMAIQSSMSMPPGSSMQRDMHKALMMANASDATESPNGSSYQQQVMVHHRVPASPEDADDRNDVGSSSPTHHDSKDPQETISKQPFDSDTHDIAASVLLLATAASKKAPAAIDGAMDDTEDTVDSSIDGSRPLKKRKAVTDILRTKHDEEQDNAIHVSPMSHNSKNTTDLSAGGTSSNDVSPNSARLEEGTTKNGAKITRNPANAMIPHFPSALHWLLTESSAHPTVPEYASVASVIQWVSHGQAWKIVRWEALRREVLPKFFPQLLDGTTTNGSIDAFLWQLSAWGFEEIKDGPDVGAYTHSSFRRGHPQLCRQMHFTPPPETKNGATDTLTPATPPSGRTASILRVPSLTSTAGSSESRPTVEHEDASEARTQHKRSNSTATDFTTSIPASPMERSSFGSPGWATSPSGIRSVANGPPVFVNYRPEEMHLAREAWQYYSNKAHPGQWVPEPSIRAQGMPPYSPIRIRSARGARRPSLHSRTLSIESSPAVSSAAATRGFVSNRGKGRRHIGAPAPASQTSDAATTEEIALLSKTEEGPVKEQEEPKPDRPRPVLKRKLPFAATASSSSSSSAGGE